MKSQASVIVSNVCIMAVAMELSPQESDGDRGGDDSRDGDRGGEE